MSIYDFEEIKKLYHYTSFKNAMKIIESKTLLFSPLKCMNDINEVYRPFLVNGGLTDNVQKTIETEIAHYQQLSFSQDDERKGFDIPAMWGHYANKGAGVCLVFDKKKILKALPENCYKAAVNYDANDIAYLFEVKNESVLPLSDEEIKDFFFRKTSDWAYEQEFRVVIKNEEEDLNKRLTLNFEDALIATILTSSDEKSTFIKEEFKLLNKLLEPIPIYEYGRFIDEVNLRDKDANEIWSNKNFGNYKLYLE